jgi:bacteriochlorophyllide a dehydrogenase
MNARSILHVGINQVEVRDVDVRDPGPGEVLIETLYSGISPGTELRCLRGKRPGSLETFPFVPGYANIGRITRRGAGVNGFGDGQTVFVSGTRHAGGIKTMWGGHISHVLTPVERVIPVPPGVDPLDATIGRLAAIAFRGVGMSRPQVGERVAVVGLGVIGQLSARLHALSGARVVGADRSAGRVEHLRGAGVTAVVAEPGRRLKESFAAAMPEGADVVVDATGNPDVLRDALELARDVPWTNDPPPGARVVLQGSYEADFTLPYQTVFDKTVTMLVPRDSTAPDLRTVLELIDAGKLKVRDLISAVRPPEAAAETYAELRDPATTLLTAVFKWR